MHLQVCCFRFSYVLNCNTYMDIVCVSTIYIKCFCLFMLRLQKLQYRLAYLFWWPYSWKVSEGLTVGVCCSSWWLWRVLFTWNSRNIGLGSFGFCSGMSSLFECNVCIYICSYGKRRFGALIYLRRVMVFSMFPYSCLQFNMCNAYAERGSLFFI